jgi:hypothetical protein
VEYLSRRFGSVESDCDLPGRAALTDSRGRLTGTRTAYDELERRNNRNDRCEQKRCSDEPHIFDSHDSSPASESPDRLVTE